MYNGFERFFIEYGYLLMVACTAILILLTGLYSKKEWHRQVFFNLFAPFLVLSLLEAYYQKTAPEKHQVYEGNYLFTPGYMADHELLGYGPEYRDFNIQARKITRGKLTYDVTYHVEEGQRVCPNDAPESKRKAIFLGGSFTFGEGVQDDQTLPYYVNARVDSPYHVFNYGFHGYGPHQALLITRQILPPLLNKQDSGKSVAIYTFIQDHVRRAAGKTNWDKQGPRFEIQHDSLQYLGSFEFPFWEHWLITKAWKQSFTYRRFLGGYAYKISDEDVQRSLWILREIRNEFAQKGIRFMVITDVDWLEDAHFPIVQTFFEEEQIEHYAIDQIIPKIRSQKSEYVIPDDNHPNPAYNEKVASFIAKRLIN